MLHSGQACAGIINLARDSASVPVRQLLAATGSMRWLSDDRSSRGGASCLGTNRPSRPTITPVPPAVVARSSKQARVVGRRAPGSTRTAANLGFVPSPHTISSYVRLVLQVSLELHLSCASGHRFTHFALLGPPVGPRSSSAGRLVLHCSFVF